MERASPYSSLPMIESLVAPDRAAVDLGANRGVYLAAMAGASSRLAVEPNPEMCAALRTCFPDVTVIQAAASRHSDSMTLKMPVVNGVPLDGLGTVGDGTRFEGMEVVTLDVPTIALDELDLGPVGFIKVDVEGHEIDALEGARRLVTRDRPIVALEAENRHRPQAVESLATYFGDLGYSGYFIMEGRLHSMGVFDINVHQHSDNVAFSHRLPGKLYINEFVYFPSPDRLLRQFVA